MLATGGITWWRTRWWHCSWLWLWVKERAKSWLWLLTNVDEDAHCDADAAMRLGRCVWRFGTDTDSCDVMRGVDATEAAADDDDDGDCPSPLRWLRGVGILEMPMNGTRSSLFLSLRPRRKAGALAFGASASRMMASQLAAAISSSPTSASTGDV